VVDREILAGAGVSEVFLDRLASLVTESDGDARALLDAIDARKDERVHRFHTAQRDRLERHFEDEGYLDPRKRLTRGEIVLRVLGAAVPHVEGGRTTPDRVREVVGFLVAAVGDVRGQI
jgi:hypothetical protein